MKILFYINVLGGGGAERVVANLANHFERDHHQIIVVASNRVDNEYQINKNVKKIYLNDNIDIKGNRIIKNIKMIYFLRYLIKKEEPDVVISFMQEPNLRAVLSSIGLKNKVIVSVRNDPEKEYPGILGQVIGKMILPLADGCVFQTVDAQRWFPYKLQKKSSIIFNEVAEQFFKISRKVPKNIVSIGRLNNQKNHVLLIRAFAKLSEKYPDEKLFIYGEGELRNFLEKEIERYKLAKKIFLMGATDHVAEVLSEAKLFVLSSDYEGMPNVLLEALAVGVPCISTDCPCGGPKTIIESGVNGFLIPINDEEELIKKIEYILNNENIANELSIAAKQSAKRFRPETVYLEWEKYVSKIIKA